MNKYLTISASTVLVFAGLSLFTGCSSGGGDGAVATPPATVPTNAVVITDANAEATVAASIATVTELENGLAAALAVETTPVIGLTAALDLVLPLIKDKLNNSGIDPVTGIVYNESGNCNVAGTWSASGDEIDVYPDYSDTLTATWVNCDDGIGMIIDGKLSASVTENNETYAYTREVTGTLSLIFSESPVEISFTGIDLEKSGDMLMGTYTTAKSTFAVNFILDGASVDGFLSKLNAPIVQSDTMLCPESGHIFITGGKDADGIDTTAEGIYNGDNATMTIRANGADVKTDAECDY